MIVSKVQVKDSERLTNIENLSNFHMIMTKLQANKVNMCSNHANVYICVWRQALLILFMRIGCAHVHITRKGIMELICYKRFAM
jgi:hypothetical protein